MALRRSLALALVAVLAGGLLASCGDGDAGGDRAVALDFSAEQLDAGSFDAASLQGEDAVLWFWAPWCTTCRAEAPDVVEVAGEFDGDVEIIGVASRGANAEMLDFVGDTQTQALRHLDDESGDIWAAYGIVSQPAFAFIDDDGTTSVHVGALGASGLREAMSQLSES